MTKRLSFPKTALQLIASLAFICGLLLMSGVLVYLLHLKRLRLAVDEQHFKVIAGISVIYLAALLRRGKYNAWLVSLPVFGLLVGDGLQDIFIARHFGDRPIALANVVVPLATLLLLLVNRKQFTVRSETRNLAVAVRRAVVILLVAFIYGFAGFQVFDHRDFRQEISPLAAASYTIDQFGFTTPSQLVPYTIRARVFVDSLTATSAGAWFYVVVSLFAPLRFRLSRHAKDYEAAAKILKKHASTSEDFFKLWPRDKAYYFNASRTAFIAYRTKYGVAMAVGDPAGPPNQIRSLIEGYMDFCRANDWRPAFIHTDEHNLKIYAQLGFDTQKIGSEALLDLDLFLDKVANNKYFRHIQNKFGKLNYSCEILKPPHDRTTIETLRRISDEWSLRPGRVERRMMMGYFSEAYLQQCALMVARDQTGRIRAFLNQVPTVLKPEANFDLLRHDADSLGNINDFLLIDFIKHLKSQGYQRLNLGLAPLYGLDNTGGQRQAIGKVLGFVYANSGPFYSFQGLARFKTKYQPDFTGRYVVYQGGLAGFSRTMTALLRAMKY